MKLKFFFCQFPNPWALRVSGMGGYTSKCQKSQNHCTLLYIFWRCLHYRGLSCIWTEASAAHGRAYTTRGRSCARTCLHYKGLCCSWRCPHSRGLSCLWTCLYFRGLCAPGQHKGDAQQHFLIHLL